MKRLQPLVRVLVPLTLMVLIWQLIDGPQTLRRLAGAGAPWLLAAVALLNLQIVASAFRWRLTARRLGQPLGRGRAVGEYYLATLANMVLPGGVLGDAGRTLRNRGDSRLATAAGAVAIERLAGQVALFALLLPALVLFGLPGAAGSIVTRTVVGAAVAGALAVVMLWLGPPPLRRLGAVLHRAWLADGVWVPQGALSAVVLACNIGAFACCAAAVGASLSPAASLIVIPLSLVAMLLPVSVGGWGLREGAAAALWPMAGGTAEGAVAASVAFGLMALAAGLPGILVPVVSRRG